MKNDVGTAKKAADNFETLKVIEVSDYIRLTVSLKANNGIKSLNIVQENKAKKTGNWYFSCAIDVPLENFGEQRSYTPLVKLQKIFASVLDDLIDFDIEGHPYYYLYGPKGEDKKRKYEGFSDQPGDRKVY